MPAMTPQLVRKTNSSLCELFVNIFEHAHSPCGGLAVGLHLSYPGTVMELSPLIRENERYTIRDS